MWGGLPPIPKWMQTAYTPPLQMFWNVLITSDNDFEVWPNGLLVFFCFGQCTTPMTEQKPDNILYQKQL